MVDELLLEDEKRVRILSDPLHQRMLSALEVHGAQTSAGLARILGGEASRFHYHLRRLEGAGLVELDHEETINGIRARYLRPAARSFRIAQSALEVEPRMAGTIVGVVRNQFDEALGLFEKVVKKGPSGGPSHQVLLTVHNLRMTVPESEEFQESLMALVKSYEDRPAEADDGRTNWHVLALALPKIADS